MRLTVLSSGPLSPAALHALAGQPTNSDMLTHDVICITNTAWDVSITGLRFAPDLDTAVTALMPGRPDPRQQHAGEASTPTRTVITALERQGLAPRGTWPMLDDEAFAQAIARVYRLGRGMSTLECAAAQSEDSPATILPLTAEPIELHVLEDDAAGERSSRHALRWLHDPDRHEPKGFVVAGVDQSSVTVGALDAIRSADVVVMVPMSPVIDAAGFLAVPGVRDALRGTSARVVAMSPVGLPGGYPDEVEAPTWALTGSQASSATLARLYADFLDELLIDDAEAPGRYPASLTVTRTPLAAALRGEPDATLALRSHLLG